MEDSMARLQRINFAAINAESGRERFHSDHFSSMPLTYLFRNNLTALSQRFNLYFVATGPFVKVYRPKFPLQNLGGVTLAIHLNYLEELANPHALGYIDQPHERHGINHLVVSDLGSEEIMVVATDSGNIAAYTTRSINGYITGLYGGKFGGISEYDTTQRLRPFFTHWVYESAWGLAVHKRGRMIAVSANLPHHVQTEDTCARVTVFAFALRSHSQRENTAGSHHEWHEWHANQSQTALPERSRNYKIILSGQNGHQTNVPNISFVNTSEDPEGNWLLSTDIHGQVKVWQVWQQRCFRTWDFSDRHFLGMYRTRDGWNVTALDPEAFIEVDNLQDLVGAKNAPMNYGSQDAGESYDISNIVRRTVPGNSHTCPTPGTAADNDDEALSIQTFDWSDGESETDSPLTSMSPSGIDLPDLFPLLSSDRPSVSDGGTEMNLAQDYPRLPGTYPANSQRRSASSRQAHASNGETPLEHPAPDLHIDDFLSEDADTDGFSDEEEFEEDLDEEMEAVSQLSMTTVSELSRRYNAEEAEDERRTLFDSSEDEAPVVARSTPNGTRASHRRLPKEVEKLYQRDEERRVQRATTRIPFIPFIHTSAAHMKLVSGPTAASPHLVCNNILHQEFPPPFNGARRSHLDRLNMIQQIPELGLVIIASQVGRCAICTMTKRTGTRWHGLRVDWILPNESQERKGQRPMIPLLGIAAGPVQGRLIPDHAVPAQGPDELFPEDAIVDGVHTSFDHDVVVVPEGTHELRLDPGAGESSKRRPSMRSASPPMKRKRSPSSSFSSEFASCLRIERRSWPIAAPVEDWHGVEHSRRYRLMLTYIDHTVLTYELWREARSAGDSKTSF